MSVKLNPLPVLRRIAASVHPWRWLDRPAHKEIHGIVLAAVLLTAIAVVRPGYLLTGAVATGVGVVIGYYPQWRRALAQLWCRRRAILATTRRYAGAAGTWLRTRLVALLRWVSRTSGASHVFVAAVIALVVAHAVSPHRFAFIAAVLGAGVALGYYPAWRQRPRSTLSPDLRVASTLEGLIAGAFKIPASLPALAIVEIATDAHTNFTWVDGGISAVSGVGFFTTWFAIRRLRARRTGPLGKRQVLMSFAGVVAGMVLFALARDGLWLAASLAVTGLGVATNARFRNVIQAQYQGGPDSREFQIQTNIWTRRVTAIGLPLFGLMMTATPLGWRGTSLLIAGAFAVLAVLSVTVRRIPGKDHQKEQDETPDDVSRLPSLARTLTFVVLSVATASIWRAGLEPALVSIGVHAAPFWTAAITFAGQVGTGGLQARLQRPNHRTPREVALRASTLLLPAAIFGPLTLLTPWWWIGIGVAIVWLMLGEAGQISSGSGTRIASASVGTIGSLYGTNAGYIGGAFGAVLAGLEPARTPVGLGLLLGGGAVASVAVAAWVPRVAVQQKVRVKVSRRRTREAWEDVVVQTAGRAVSFVFKRVDDEIVAVISDERGRRGRLTLRESHQLLFTQRFRRGGEQEKAQNRSARETYTVGRLTVWFGPAWWMITCLLWLTHRRNRLFLLRPIAFAMRGEFHGLFRWTAEGRATAAVTYAGDEIRVDVTFDRERELWLQQRMPNDAADKWRLALD